MEYLWIIIVPLFLFLIWISFQPTRVRADEVRKLYCDKVSHNKSEGNDGIVWILKEEFKGFEFYDRLNINGKLKKIERGKIDPTSWLEKLKRMRSHHIGKLNFKEAVYSSIQTLGLNEQVQFIDRQIEKIYNCFPVLKEVSPNESLDMYFSKTFTPNIFKRIVSKKVIKEDGWMIRTQLSKFSHYLVEISLLKYPHNLKKRQEALEFGRHVYDFFNLSHSTLAKGPQEFDTQRPTEEDKRLFKMWLQNEGIEST